MATNSDIIRRFLTSPNRERYFPKGKHCGFEGDTFFSFGFPIAKLTPSRSKKAKLCFVTNRVFGNPYINQHIKILKDMSPWKIMQIDLANSMCFNLDTSVNNMSNTLAYYIKQHTSTQSTWHRNYFRMEAKRLFSILLEIHINYRPVAVVARFKDVVKEF